MYQTESANVYEKNIEFIHEYLAHMAWTFDPKETREHRDCYVKNVNELPNRHRFHTGHVIVYKKQVYQHQDKNDTNFCLTFAHGEYTGGHMCMPELGHEVHLYVSPRFVFDRPDVLRYRPGHVAVFRSGTIYHGVTTWRPEGDVSEIGITPGRVAHVFTTHQSTMEGTKEKEPGWKAFTAGGLQPKDETSKWTSEELALDVWDRLPAAKNWLESCQIRMSNE